MSGTAGDGASAAPGGPRRDERSFVFGYIAGASVAWMVFSLGVAAWDGTLPSRHDLGLWVFVSAFAVPITGVAALVPFACVRRLSGAWGFASPWRAMALGAVVGTLTIPLGVGLGRVFTLDGPVRPYRVDMVESILSRWPFYAAAGAAGGAAYWLVEFSAFPEAAIRLFGDARPLPWTGGLLSRRLAAAAAVLALAASVPAAEWWWGPHVHQSLASGVPRVAVAEEWRSRRGAGFLAWAADRSRVISLSDDGRLTVRDRGSFQERQIPRTRSGDATGDQHLIAAPDTSVDRNAFFVADVDTGEVLHREPDPAPGRSGSANGAVRLALSPDGNALAVAYGAARAGQPLSLYSTRSWRRVASFDPPDPRQGVWDLAFSGDGTRLAVVTWGNLFVLDVRTGTVLGTIPIRSRGVAFSPDGGKLAVSGERPTDRADTRQNVVRIFRLDDGMEIASRDAGPGFRGRISWDPLGRFVVFRDGKGLRLWNPSKPSSEGAMLEVRPYVSGFALSPDGSRLAIATEAAMDSRGVTTVFRIID